MSEDSLLNGADLGDPKQASKVAVKLIRSMSDEAKEALIKFASRLQSGDLSKKDAMNILTNSGDFKALKDVPGLNQLLEDHYDDLYDNIALLAEFV